MGDWIIEARAFRIYYTPFTHAFWLLRDAAGAVADQLHGLAVDPVTGATKAVGSSAHLLQVVRGREIAWALQPGQRTAAAAGGREEEVAPRWQAAVAAAEALNALGLRYPDLWQHGWRPNCNSVFSTLGLIMGFSSPALLLGTWAPGIRLPVSPEIVERYRWRTSPTG
jgi:hypothetical protein